MNREVLIELAGITLQGDLTIPPVAKGIIIFSHGSGSSRHSPRNKSVAAYLLKKGFATLLPDLLTPDEDKVNENRFNIELLTRRLTDATRWLMQQASLSGLPFGYFGASTGAASALKAAARNQSTGAVVSRGGRPDLAMDEIENVNAPTLLIVGSLDADVLNLNTIALDALTCYKSLEIVPGASHLFEEPGTLERVSQIAGEWFERFLFKKL
ncbi:MAG: dienelactone hydrolase family protein [Chitinophagaceae bacterium]|nr:dienelactone hydrolase family protein [Chitinophagaceae bacterium]